MFQMLLNKIRKKIRVPAVHGSGEKGFVGAALWMKFPEVLNACETLQGLTKISPRRLACWYMSSITEQHPDTAWWRENETYITQAWFIYEYACEHGMIQRAERGIEPPRELFDIKPEQVKHEGCVIIRVERAAGEPTCGSVSLVYVHADREFQKLVSMHRYQRQEQVYIRQINETDNNICDRVVETAVILLQQGYCVCVEEEALRKRILAEEYEAAYPYWVLEGATADSLELRYPRDKQLHSYIYRAGGRWNGKAVEISICDAPLLEDLIRLYHFRITGGAKIRMDAWQNTVENAMVYRPRHRKGEQESEPLMVDRFMELMERKVKVLDDLWEDDA